MSVRRATLFHHLLRSNSTTHLLHVDVVVALFFRLLRFFVEAVLSSAVAAAAGEEVRASGVQQQRQRDAQSASDADRGQRQHAVSRNEVPIRLLFCDHVIPTGVRRAV